MTWNPLEWPGKLWAMIKAWYTFVFTTAAQYIPWLSVFMTWLTGENTGRWAWMVSVLKFLGTLAVFLYTLLELLLPLVDIPGALDALTLNIELATASLQTLPVSSTISKANRVFPIDQLLGFVSILLGVKALAFGVRIVLKFIPFIG